MAGVTTNYCVPATIIDAYHVGFDEIILPLECVNASNEERHQSGLLDLRRHSYCTVVENITDV